MENSTIFTKTAKGVGEAVGRTKSLSRDFRKVLKEIDGSASIDELHSKLGGFSETKLHEILTKLASDDYIREFVQPLSGDTMFDLTGTGKLEEAVSKLTIGDFLRELEPQSTEQPAEEAPDGFDLSFRSLAAPEKKKVEETQAKVREEEVMHQEMAARYKQRMEAKPVAVDEAATAAKAAKAAEESARKAAEEKAKAEALALAKKEAEEKMRRVAEEKARQEAELRAKKLAEEKARRDAEEKVRAEAEARIKKALEERAKQEAEAQAKKLAQEQARREAEEKAKREAEARAKKEADERARLEAEARAKKEAEEKAKREAEEKAKREAEQKAKREAEEKAKQEAEERAKREAEEKAKREAEARAKKEAEERARLEAEAKQKAEEQARREVQEAERRKAEDQARRAAELKAAREAAEKEKAEAEEKARQDAANNARMEAEAYARRAAELKLKREAEERAKREEALIRRKAQEQFLREAEEKLKREADELARKTALENARREDEARAKKEAEEQARLQARREAEEKARLEAEAQAKKDAEEKAQREEKLQAQRAAEEKARLEAEAKLKKEAEEKARREAEEQARKEAEARAAAEKAAREAAERAAREAAETARLEKEAEARKAAEQQAMREAEERAKRDAELQAQKELEAQTRQQEEERARKEAEEKSWREAEELAKRVAEEQAMRNGAAAPMAADTESGPESLADLGEQETVNSEIPQVKEELEKVARKDSADEKKKAKQQARQEAKRLAKEKAEARALRVAENKEKIRLKQQEAKNAKALAKAEKVPYKRNEKAYNNRSFNLGKPIVVILFLLIMAGFALVQMISFQDKVVQIQKSASAQLQQPVKIGAVRLAMVPQPHWRLDDVSIGNEGQIKLPEVQIMADLGSLFKDEMNFKSIRLISPTLNEEALGWLLFGKQKAGDLKYQNISATNVTLNSKIIQLPHFDIWSEIGSDGGWKKIVLDSEDKRFHTELLPQADGVQLEVTSSSYTFPFGSSLTLATFSAKATVRPNEMDVSEFAGSYYGGVLNGNAQLKWGDSWSIKGDVNAKFIDVAQMAPALLDGTRLDGSAKYAYQAKTPEKLLATPRLRGSFVIRNGTVLGVDLLNFLRSASGGGKSSFNELTGNASYEGDRLQLVNLRLGAGLVSASGYATVEASNKVNGDFSIELRSPTMHMRSNAVLSGTLSEPSFHK
jgi:hypothetical protein